LVPKDAPHEYASSSSLVELALDEDEHLCSPHNASSLRLVGGQLPFDKTLKDWGPPVGIFEIQLRLLIDRHDFRFFDLWRLLPLCSHRGRVLIAGKNPVRYRLATGCSLCEHVGGFVVVAQHMMEFEPMELSL
jgi:hypothetical protein